MNLMKRNASRIITAVVIIAAIAGIIGFYVYDIIVNGTEFSKYIFRVAAIVFMLLGTLIRIIGTRGRKNLQFYEKAYEKELGQAFNSKPMARKKLLCALRLYNESNYDKALKYLFDLYKQAENPRDALPVLLFIALCFTDAGCHEDAAKVYYQMLEIDHRDARVHSNLGYQLMTMGDFDLALQHFGKSVEYNPENYFAYVNRANCYFKKADYENAQKDAEKALETKNNGKEAASLLAVLAALREDEESRKQYTRIYVNNGGSADELNESIEHYMSAEE